MAVTKARKAEQVEKLSADLKGVHNMVVATFSKLTVNQDFELRKAVRSADDAVELSDKMKDKHILLRVWRGGASRYLVVDESKAG